MTDQPHDTTPPAGAPNHDVPPEGAEAGAGGARAREWLNQLEAMIADITTQAAPVARQVGAKAAELAAIAAVKAGPIAHRAAEVTTDVGQRFAERAQSVAAELRGEMPVTDGPTAKGPATDVQTEPNPASVLDDDGSPSA